MKDGNHDERLRRSQFLKRRSNRSLSLPLIICAGRRSLSEGERISANAGMVFPPGLTHSLTPKLPRIADSFTISLLEPLSPNLLLRNAVFYSRRHPSIKWAQRSDKVYITIELPDAENVKLKLQPEGRLYFSATSGPDSIQYEVDLELYDKVNVEESKAAVGLRNICYLVKKAENRWWSRLVKQGGKPPIFLKVDWDKWIDEDDETENRGEAHLRL
ncbi:hypothetical protein KSP40_PGU019554 [Platanthera guangdongensis]|uniref:Co-chaperone protein p23 n=1 Tax=Platanthera guangdongensis TaxID=2320717 RepID=A0ABR2N0K2_9ASPA